MLRVFCCCYFCFFFFNHNKNVLIWASEGLLASKIHCKPENQERDSDNHGRQPSPHFRLKKASSPGLLTKQDQAALLGGTFGPMGPGFPGLPNTAIAMQLEGELVSGLHHQEWHRITAPSLRRLAFSVLRVCWLNSHSSEPALASGNSPLILHPGVSSSCLDELMLCILFDFVS